MLTLRTLLLVLPLLLFALPAQAQINTNALGNQPEMTVSPEFPRPGQTVEVALQVPSFETYNAEIIWRVNDQMIGDANNQKSMKFVAGEVGTLDVITASVIKPSGITRVYKTNAQPTYIDIVLEPQTRVPDFYLGRALPSIGSQVNATVLINNGELLGTDYVYTWRVNNKVLNGGPVRGANQVGFDTPRGSRVTLSVAVSDPNGGIVGRRAIYFESVRPELLFYETNPLFGQSNIAIDDSLLLIGSASTIIAEPYHLDIKTYNNPDISDWEIDRSTQTNNQTDPYQITIQKVSEGGISEVSFHVRNTTELLQGVEDSIKIVY